MSAAWYSSEKKSSPPPTAARHIRERGEMQGRHAKARDGLNKLHEEEIASNAAHGCPLDTLRRALTRNADGSASGPLAAALDLLDQHGAPE
jgi:hypothetical protein